MNTIIINVEGGVVTHVTVKEPTKVILLDYDIQGADEKEVCSIQGETCKVGEIEPQVDPDCVDNIEQEIKEDMSNGNS